MIQIDRTFQSRFLVAGCLVISTCTFSAAQEVPESASRTQRKSQQKSDDAVALPEPEQAEPGNPSDRQTAGNSSRRHALIVVGLPGDQENRDKFAQITTSLQKWLSGFAGVGPNDITMLDGSEPGDKRLAANQESIRSVAKGLTSEIAADESLWVFLIGHGSIDNRHGWFHLPGPDMNAEQWASLFADVKASEQVFWLMHSGSGRFLKPFSLPGRTVITATDAEEVNLTRFPEAFIQVVNNRQEAGKSAADKDAGDDVSRASVDKTPVKQTAKQPGNVRDLFLQVSDEVRRSFDKDNVLATEHAQLDDNGDGMGTESNQLADFAPDSASSGAAGAVIDGLRAAKITFTPVPPLTPQQPTDGSATNDTESQR